MVLVLAVGGAIWPILIQSIYAARQGEALLVEMAKSYRIPKAWFIRHIFVPGAIPFVMTGLRLGTTICLLLTISGELLGSAPGVGYEIANWFNVVDSPTFIDDFSEGTLGRRQSDLGIEGIFAQLGLVF